MDRRRHSVVVRMSDAELEAVDTARSGTVTELSRARWVWAAIEAELGRAPGPGAQAAYGELVKEILAAHTALDRIGRNLNQALAVAHSTGAVEPAQIEAILERVDQAARQVSDATLTVTDRRSRWQPRPPR